MYYRIHHSYQNINYKLLFSSVLLFYLFLIPFSLIYFLSQYKNFDLLKINSNFINKLFNFFLRITSDNSTDRNRVRIIFFTTIGLILTLLNRSTFFICNNPILINLYGNYPILEKIGYKFHTISYFGIYIFILGLILFYKKISISKKVVPKILYFILILPIFFSLMLGHSGGSGMIIIYFLIIVLISTRTNKNIFQIHIIFLAIAIFTFMSVKKEIRVNMPSDNACKLGFHITPIIIVEASRKIFKTNDLKYNNEKGELININLDEVSPFRYRIANIFERIDFLQMLTQTQFLINNNILEYKKGETYLNRKINWKKQFGYDLRQLYPQTPSSFNMPAIVESYYNFGAYGIFIFSLIVGIINVIIFKILRNCNNNFYLQCIFIISFSQFLIHENDFIFAIKNFIYCFTFLISVTIFLELILSKILYIKQ